MASSDPYMLPFSLEQYIRLHGTLTKGQYTVQPVSDVEQSYYKISELKHVCGCHSPGPLIKSVHLHC